MLKKYTFRFESHTVTIEAGSQVEAWKALKAFLSNWERYTLED